MIDEGTTIDVVVGMMIGDDRTGMGIAMSDGTTEGIREDEGCSSEMNQICAITVDAALCTASLRGNETGNMIRAFQFPALSFNFDAMSASKQAAKRVSAAFPRGVTEAHTTARTARERVSSDSERASAVRVCATEVSPALVQSCIQC